MPLLPPLYSLSFSLILLCIHGICSASSNPCFSSSLCGNITVTYPFSLYDPYTTNNQTHPLRCGYPGLQIYCADNETPILFLSTNNYTITNISYTRKTISLVDTDILLQGSSTPKVRHNVSLPANSSLNYTELVVNLTFFLNCASFGPSYDPETITPEGNIIKKYSYIFPTTAIPLQNYSEWVSKCKNLVVVPVLGPIVSPHLLDLPTTYGAVLQEGFQLEWSGPSEYCLWCEERGGECGYNVTSNSTFIPTCFCKDGSCGTYDVFHLLIYTIVFHCCSCHCCIKALLDDHIFS